MIVGCADGRAITVANAIVTDLDPAARIGINRNGQVAIISGGKLLMYRERIRFATSAPRRSSAPSRFQTIAARSPAIATFGHGPEPFVYDGVVHEVPGAFGDGGAVAINNAGQVLGSGEGIYGFIVEGGQAVTLDKLAASSGGAWHHMEGKAINDRGWIVGQGGGTFTRS